MQRVEAYPNKEHCVVDFSESKPYYKDLSQRWLYKKTKCLWKLFVLVFLGFCGVYLCIVGVEHQSVYHKFKPGLPIAKKAGIENACSKSNINLADGLPVHYPQPVTYNRKDCRCTPVHYFVIFSMQRSGSGWFETLLNSHPNVSSHGEVFIVNGRWRNISTIKKTLDTVYNLDWSSSASKNECTAAVGLKWMLNQGVMEYKREVAAYLKDRAVSVIFLFRRNLLKRYVSILANNFDQEAKQLNGKHQSHVHSKEEANVLAAFKPSVNLSSLLSYLHRIEDIMNDVQESFNETHHMRLYYEDLVKNPEVLQSAQEFLGLQPKNLESQHIKIHTLPLSDQIENWSDLSGRLKGTKYESFLNEKDYL